MPNFRAINRPSKSPLKPTSGKRPLSHAVSQQNCTTDGGQASTPSPMRVASAAPNTENTGQQGHLEVLIPERTLRASPKKRSGQSVQVFKMRPCAAQDKQSCGESKGKCNIEQAVAKARKVVDTRGREKRNSGSSASIVRRQQAPREKKIVPSIEHSARKKIASSTPDCDTDEANQSDYVPSLAESSIPNTPSRRSPRNLPSTCLIAGPSAISESSSDLSLPQSPPQADGMLAVIKEESTTAPEDSRNLETSAMPKSASPSIWNGQLRRKRYKKADFVELPKEVFEYEKTKKERKEIRQLLALKKEAMIAGKRKEKGKLAQRACAEEKYESTEKSNKRRAGDEAEQSQSRKRQKPLKSHKPNPEDGSVVDDGKAFSKEPPASKQLSARRSPRGKITERRDPSDITDGRTHAGIRAEPCISERSITETAQCSFELQVPKEQLSHSDDQASRDRKQQRRPLNEDWRKPYERRELSFHEVLRSCSCAELHEYFTSKPDRVPCLAKWPGGKLEFFEHVKQISCCRGSIHPPNVVDACRRMLRREGYPDRGDEQSLDSVFEFASGILSTNVRDGDHWGRAQSSIPPPNFYGYGQSYRPSPDVGSSSHFAESPNETPRSMGSQLRPPKEARNKITTQTSPLVGKRVGNTTNPAGPSVSQQSSSTIVDGASSFPTPPDSSPFGKRRGVDIASHHIFDESTCAAKNMAVSHISKDLPEACSGLPKPLDYFATQRNRHQSAPAEFARVRRRNAVSDHDLSMQPTEGCHRSPLRETSDNAILQDMRVLRVQLAGCKRMLEERLPPMPTTQSGVVQPTTAPTVAAAAEDVNRPQQPNVRKRKRPSRAERKLKCPELDRNVPMHLRLPDQGIIDIGRIVNPYQRHVKAPEAFSRGGCLHQDYKHLLTQQNNGVSVWTADEIKRVSRCR